MATQSVLHNRKYQEAPPAHIHQVYWCADTCVTVVDASLFFDRLDSVQRASEASERANGDIIAPDDDALIPDLLMHQLEFADVIVLNKADLLGPAALDAVSSTIVKLNPRARLHTTTFAKVCNLISFRCALQSLTR
jgi:G3E family GTPase